MCGHTPGKVAGRQETVKAEMNGLTPGLDRSPPPRWMGGQGGQSLKVFGRTRSFWGLSSPKIEMGGKALKWLSRLDYPLAKWLTSLSDMCYTVRQFEIGRRLTCVN